MKSQALQMISEGVSRSEVCRRLQINPATLRVWISRANTDTAKRPTETAKPKIPYIPKSVRDYAEKNGVAMMGTVITQPKQKRVKLPDVATLRNFAIASLLVSVIVGHSALVWYDCGQMWGIPGAIGGGVTFLIVLAALLLASDETKPRTSDTALWFVFFIDVAAWFVHYPTFKKYADIGNVETGMFAVFLCGCSFAALYIFRDSKLD